MLVKFAYTCHRAGCKNPDFYSYSQPGLDVLIRCHEIDHAAEQRRNMQAFDEALRVGPKRNYNTLVINLTDMGFLKTRGIQVDDTMEIDFKRSESC
jgi:hypothetical protein